MYEDFGSDLHVKKEKLKARDLRKSRWWKQRRDHAKCYYCCKALEPVDVTMDHVIPLSRGGKTTKGNVVVACKNCNNLKKNLTAVEWVQYLDAVPSHSDC